MDARDRAISDHRDQPRAAHSATRFSTVMLALVSNIACGSVGSGDNRFHANSGTRLIPRARLVTIHCTHPLGMLARLRTYPQNTTLPSAQQRSSSWMTLRPLSNDSQCSNHRQPRRTAIDKVTSQIVIFDPPAVLISTVRGERAQVRGATYLCSQPTPLPRAVLISTVRGEAA